MVHPCSGEMNDILLPHLQSEEVLSSSYESIQTRVGVVSSDDLGAIVASTSSAWAASYPAVCSGDFGKVVRLKSTNHRFTNKEKFALLKHCFLPSLSYIFPEREISGRQRAFQHSWYNGLCYLVSDNGGYCKVCVLFASIALVKVLGRQSHQAAVETALSFFGAGK